MVARARRHPTHSKAATKGRLREPMPTKTPDPTPTRSITPGVAAGRLYERLRADFEAEQEELKRTPDDIRKRHRERRDKWLAEADPQVTALVKKMVAEEKPAE